MKKILLLFGVILLSSFTSTNRENDGYMPFSGEQMQTITYKGHTYIVYRFAKSDEFGGAGMVHDPDCKCHNAEKQLINKISRYIDKIDKEPQKPVQRKPIR